MIKKLVLMFFVIVIASCSNNSVVTNPVSGEKPKPGLFSKDASKGISLDSILNLQKEVETKLQTLGSRSHNAQLILNHLYQRPIIDAQKVKDLTGLSSPSVYKLIEELEKLEILTEITGGKRGKIYLFREYTKLFK